MNGSEQQQKQLASLRIKYKIGQDRTVSSESFLYLILTKAELGIAIADLEFQWLAENSLFNAIRALKELEQFRVENRYKLEQEFLQLRTKYQIPDNLELPLSSPIYSVLWKLDTEGSFQDSEIKLFHDNGCTETAALIPDILNFAQLKIKYKATQHLNQIPEDPLYSILKKLALKEQLSDAETNWLIKLNLDETIKIYQHQEKEKQAEIEFLQLKLKYQVSSHPDIFISSPLYLILKKIKAKKDLESSECQWLEQQKLTSLIEIDRVRKQKKLFAKLKIKYKAEQDKNLDIYSYLFTVLEKIEKNQVSESDIHWLNEQKLSETVKIARQIHFKILQQKYEIRKNKLPIIPLYEIMLKLDREERLAPEQVVYLITQNWLSSDSKIVIAHYQLEAKFYEQEYQRTGNEWNLASASSNWRKAHKPQKALKVTQKIDWNTVKKSKLKSALLVTRGGAFRDLQQLNDAEICAKQAMQCQPDAYQPYTLMGAICYDKHLCSEGDKWFDMAVERGAKPEDIDKEIKKIVRITQDKNKRQKLIKHLLDKDSKRYAWVKSYLEQKNQNINSKSSNIS